MLRHNPGLKLVSLLLAFFLWFSINVTERDAERTLALQVAVHKIHPDLILTNPPAKRVRVRVRGPRSFLEGLDEDKRQIALDLSQASPGERRLKLTEEMIRPELEARLKVVRFDPPRMRLNVERLVRRRLPVRADLAGMPALGYTIAESSVAPPEVEVRGPASKVDDLKDIATEPVELHGLTASVQREVLLGWAGDFVSFVPDRVLLTVQVEEVMVSRDFKQVQVRTMNVTEGLKAALSPNTVEVTIHGPQRVLHNYKIPQGSVYVDAAGLAPGNHTVTVRIDVQGRLEVTRQQPESFTLRLTGTPKPPDAATPADASAH